MKTICAEYADKNRWLPTPILVLDAYLYNFFKTQNNIPYVTAIRKNISYNIQYLQFQSQLLSELKPTSVILTQTYKVYIIIGTSIIECILYYLLMSKDLHTTNPWEEIGKTSNEIKLIESEIHKIENRVFKKLASPITMTMKFDDMVKKVQNKKLLGNNPEIYKKLNYLRKLRNRVHLQSVEYDDDSDWWKFNFDDIRTMKNVLHLFLTSSLFKPTLSEKQIFEFLKN